MEILQELTVSLVYGLYWVIDRKLCSLGSPRFIMFIEAVTLPYPQPIQTSSHLHNLFLYSLF